MDDIFIPEERIDDCTRTELSENIESQRLSLRRRKLIFLTTACAAVIVFVVVCKTCYMPGQSGGYALAALSLIAALWLFRAVYLMSFRRSLRKSFHKDLMARYITALLPDAAFHHDKSLDASVLADSHLFSITNDRCKGSDLITAGFNDAELSFAWLKTAYKRATNTEKGTKTSWHPLFSGWMLRLHSKKHPKGCTIVIPAEAEEYPGGWGKWLQQATGDDGQTVKFEQSKFSHEFEVFSTHPDVARLILTNNVQDILLKVKQKYAANVRLSIVDGTVYLALESKQGFTLRTSLSFLDAKTPQIYLQPLIDALTLAQAVQMNIKLI